MTGIIQLTTTLETQDQAHALASRLVESRLAACVQVSGPIHSVYRWQGEVQNGVEFRCTIKSIKPLADKLMQVVSHLHPYDTPEILITDVAQVSEAYGDWLRLQITEASVG